MEVPIWVFMLIVPMYSMTCRPIGVDCSIGFLLENGEKSDETRKCTTVSVMYNFVMTKSCLSAFDVAPTLEIENNCELTIDVGMFKTKGGIIVSPYVNTTVSGVTNLNELKSFQLGTKSRLTIMGDLVFDSDYTMPYVSCSLNVYGDVIVRGSAVFQLNEQELTVTNLRLYDTSVFVGYGNILLDNIFELRNNSTLTFSYNKQFQQLKGTSSNTTKTRRKCSINKLRKEHRHFSNQFNSIYEKNDRRYVLETDEMEFSTKATSDNYDDLGELMIYLYDESSITVSEWITMNYTNIFLNDNHSN
ncbi:hypothetical protein EIN_221700, partial [Entamoeba invadens IP1]